MVKEIEEAPDPLELLLLAQEELDRRLQFDWWGELCPNLPECAGTWLHRPADCDLVHHGEPCPGNLSRINYSCHHVRPQQRPPADDDWLIWLFLLGRGGGKTKSCAEWICKEMREHPNWKGGLVGITQRDLRDTMIEGVSGVLACLPPSSLVNGNIADSYTKTLHQITLSNGSKFTGFSSEKPDSLRGPEFNIAWGDEFAQWSDANAPFDSNSTFSNLMLCLRRGKRGRTGTKSRLALATTPKPVRLLLGDDTDQGLTERDYVHVVHGSTYDNLINLSETFQKTVLRMYEGTAIGRQELWGEMVEDVKGALWKSIDIKIGTPPLVYGTNGEPLVDPSGNFLYDLVRVVVGIDPSGTTKGDECGLVVFGVDRTGHGWVLEDGSVKGSPETWARKADYLYEKWHADCMVAETNFGGEMVLTTLRTSNKSAAIRQVHASHGKIARAQPISRLYEQGRISHLQRFEKLELQMCSFVPGVSKESPDHMDAMVWAATYLMVGPDPEGWLNKLRQQVADMEGTTTKKTAEEEKSIDSEEGYWKPDEKGHQRWVLRSSKR